MKGQVSSELYVTGIVFNNNYAHYGGVFSVQRNSTCTCTDCEFYNNFAAFASIAYVVNNGQLIIDNGIFQDNYALNYYLFYIIGSRFQSKISNSEINENAVYTTEEVYDQIVLTIQTAFDDEEDTSILDEIYNSINVQSSILIQRTLLLIENTDINNQDNFTQAVINSYLTISECNFKIDDVAGFVFNSFQSQITIQDSTTFSQIYNKSEITDVYIFKLAESSVLTITDTTFTQMTIPFAFLQTSTFTMTDSSITSVDSYYTYIDSRLSSVTFTSSSIETINQHNEDPLIKIYDSSVLTTDELSITKFTARAFDILQSTVDFNGLTLENYLYESSESTGEYSYGIKTENSKISISSSKFYNISNSKYGGALYALQSKSDRYSEIKEITITGTTFELCSSNYGGAIYADFVDISITSSTFTSNSASEGGAVYFSCCQDCSSSITNYKCTYSFSENTCIKNTATSKGGCFNTDLYQVTEYLTSTYTENTATYGNDYSAYPYSVQKVTYDEETDTYTANTDTLIYVSGQQISDPFYFALYDMYDQIITIEDSAIGTIVAGDDTLTIDTQDTALSIAGIFNFSTTKFTSDPGFSGTFTFETDDIDSDIYNKASGTTYEEPTINLQLRNCIQGEAISSEVCVTCGAGTYSLTENAEECEDCPDHAECSGYDINPDFGYYRKTNTSTTVHKCYYSYACIGGSYNACDTESGYSGILCHECIYDYSNSSLQFTRSDEHYCAKCPETSENIRTYVLMFVAQEAYIFFLTNSYYKNLASEKENTVLIRIFTTYSQIVTYINSYDLNWPSIISTFISGVGAPAEVTSALYSVDCLLKDLNIVDAERTLIVSLAITTLSPIAQFLVSLIVYFFAWAFRMKQLKIKMLITVTVIYYLSYPQIVKDTFGLFTCTEEIDGVQYLVKNTNIICYESTHIKIILLLGIPNMIVWIFGMPIWILRQLYKKRKDLDHIDNLRTFGFWYLGLKRNRFFWELSLELKKLMIITVTVNIMGLEDEYQVFLILIVLYIYFILSANLKPYKIEYLNTVSYYSELAEVCTFAFMMIFLRTSTNSDVDNLVFVILVIANILFFSKFIFYTGRFYYYLGKDVYKKIRDVLDKRKIKKSSASLPEMENFDKLADQKLVQIMKEKGTIDEKEFLSLFSNELETKDGTAKRRKKRKAPNAKIYKSRSIKADAAPRKRDSSISFDSPQSKATNNNDDFFPNSSQQLKERESSSQMLSSHQISEMKRKEKIQKNKIKQEKKQKKKKLLLEGQEEISLQDYIIEEKKRLMRIQMEDFDKQMQQEKKVVNNNSNNMKIEKEETIHIKDFNLSRDKNGHLLNDDVLQKINKLL